MGRLVPTELRADFRDLLPPPPAQHRGLKRAHVYWACWNSLGLYMYILV